MSLIGLNYTTNKHCAPDVENRKLGAINLYSDKTSKHFENDNFDLTIVGNAFFKNSQLIHIEKDLEEAEGTFSYCLWLKLENKIVVGTDKLGFYPLYYTNTNDKICFANFLFHIKPFLHSPKPCWDAWDELLNERDVLGDKTTIDGVKRLRQGQKLTILKNVLSVIDFWKFKSPQQVGFDEYIDVNNTLMKESLGLLNSDNMVIPSTGGHDSRRIIITANSLKQNFSTITQETEFKEELDVDSFIAKQVAEELNINNHKQLGMLEKGVFDRDVLYKDKWNGFESPNHGWAVNLLRHLPNKSNIFDGIVGDITINNHFITDFQRFNKSRENIDFLISEHIAEHRFFQIKSSLLSESNECRIKSELQRFDNDANRFNLFKVFNHTRRNIGHWFSPFLLHDHNVSLPYCYSPLFEQSFALKADERAYATAHFAAMCKINHNVGVMPSTRTHENMEFWRSKGVNKVQETKTPVSLELSPLPNHIFKYFEQSFKDVLFDNIAFKVTPQLMLSAKPWRYEPLQRLYQFLTWLETDHSSLPILHKEPLPSTNKWKST